MWVGSSRGICKFTFKRRTARTFLRSGSSSFLGLSGHGNNVVQVGSLNQSIISGSNAPRHFDLIAKQKYIIMVGNCRVLIFVVSNTEVIARSLRSGFFCSFLDYLCYLGRKRKKDVESTEW